jgi:ABC-2 type transport system permease protein
MINTKEEGKLLQQILGRNYKWWFVLMNAVKRNTNYRWNTLYWLFGSMIIIVANLFVWSANINSGSSLFTIKDAFTYFIIGEMFLFSTVVYFDIAERIGNGKFVVDLLKPNPVLLYYCVRCFGWMLFENLGKFVIYGIVALILNQYIFIPDLPNFLIFLVLAFCHILIFNLMSVCVGCIAFWTVDAWGPLNLYENLRLICSGRLFPLTISVFTSVFIYTPFAFTFYLPMQVYLEKFDFNQSILTLIAAIVWILVLFVLANFILKRGLKKKRICRVVNL